MADIKSEQAAGFKSVHVAGFTLECLAGPVGIRKHFQLQRYGTPHPDTLVRGGFGPA